MIMILLMSVLLPINVFAVKILLCFVQSLQKYADNRADPAMLPDETALLQSLDSSPAKSFQRLIV